MLLKMMQTADPLPFGPGEYQADPADLARMEAQLQGLVPSGSTASDSSTPKHPLDNTSYKADQRPINDQRSE